MRRPDWVPAEVDVTLPSAARVYDAYLGGAHNFEVDRTFVGKAKTLLPHVADVARWNRTFLRRAVDHAAREHGVRQFLDLGCGLPVTGAVHEVARQVDPAARVVYVDNEPVAVAQGDLLLSGDERASIIRGDVLEPESVLRHAETRRLLDLSEPVCVLMVALLHFIPDSDDPFGVVARFRDAMPAGSLFAISHATVDGVPEPVRSQTQDFIDSYKDTQNPGFVARDANEFAGFFDGFELLDPGITYTPQWRPEHPIADSEFPERAVCLAAVGRKV